MRSAEFIIINIKHIQIMKYKNKIMLIKAMNGNNKKEMFKMRNGIDKLTKVVKIILWITKILKEFLLLYKIFF